MTREEAYDSKVNPLMAQIIAICKEHGIPMLCSFYLADEHNETLACTSALLSDDLEPPESFLEAYEWLKPQNNSMLMITTRDKDNKITNMTAVL